MIARSAGLAQLPQEQDLAVRAAHALRRRCGTHIGVDIAIEKRIPAGAGLGGGSSDAATVLVALNELWELGLAVDELAAIGLAVGADVQASVVWKFTPMIVGRVGYQCIFIDGLALGSDNFSRNAPLLSTGHTEIENTGQLTLHGPFAGLTVTW